MKSLLAVTALLEGVTGLGLATVPSLVVSILLGTSFTDPAAILIGRLAGAALITIAIACWLSRDNTLSPVMVKTMVCYNIFATTLLGYSVFVEKICGPGLWPAVIIHSALLVWSLSSLRSKASKVVHHHS